MKFGYTILYVENVAETVEFYQKAFDCTAGMVTEQNQYGELVTGDTKLAFAANEFVNELSGVPYERVSQAKHAPPFEVAFVTEDVPGAYARALAAGAIAMKEPAAKPWGQVVAYVRDNNGFLIELCSPM